MDESAWLKSVWEESSIATPNPKRIKFSDVCDELHVRFPERKYSSYEVSQLVRTTFPNTVNKRCGKSRQTQILGLERKHISATCAVQAVLQPNTSDCTLTDNPASSTSDRTANIPTSSFTDILIENQELKARIQELEKNSAAFLSLQADAVIRRNTTVTEGPTTIDKFNELDLKAITAELKSQAPDLYNLFMALGDVSRNQKEDEVTTEEVKAVASLCSLLNARSATMHGLQLLMSMMLVARATSKQAITVLSHTGVCMSYTSTWTYLMKLTQDEQYAEIVKTGHWIWIYDNLNLHQKVRHERGDKHSTMLNVTARLAMRIDKLPDWDVDWDDITPQRPRSCLTSEHFMPGKDDAAALNDSAIEFMMEFLVEEFECLRDLKQFIPCRKSPQPAKSPTVAPMCILFKDEKYTAETVEIIRELMSDANLSGNSQVIVGDQLTCKNIRAMKAWVQSEIEPKQRLKWAHENPGDFHFLWECLRVIYTIFWGTPSEVGSLCNARELVNRKLVTKAVKVFNVGDEFVLHTFRAHLIASVCSILGVTTPSESIEHPEDKQWLEEKAKMLVQHTIYPAQSKDPVYTRHRAFLHLGFLYVNLRHAIRWEDGLGIIRHWKLWLPRFIGTGCKNYATEAVNLIAHLEADYPRHIAYIATHNRTVNTSGLPGRGKPLDQLMEHYVLVIKQALRSSGANNKPKHIKDVSMCALLLLKAAKKCDAVFKVPPKSTSHTTADSKADITKIQRQLQEKAVAKEDKSRSGQPFTDPTNSGLSTLTNGEWLPKQLQSRGGRTRSSAMKGGVVSSTEECN